MANTLFLNTRRSDTGLQTATYTVPTAGAGLYYVEFEVTEFPPSSLVVVVNKNGSPSYTAPTITPTQIELKFKTNLSLADADVVTIVMTSSDDSTLNSLKSNVSIGQGQ